MTLQYLKFVGKPSGLVLRYLRYPGASLIRLPDGDMGSDEFLADYTDAKKRAKEQAASQGYDPATVGDFDLLDFAMENLATSPFRRIFGQWVMVCFGNRKTAPTGGKVT